LDKSLRVACFSATDGSPHDEMLMWSHYSKSHRGVRIGFEFPENIKSPFRVGAVTYQNSRVALDMSLNAYEKVVQDALIQSIRTKGTGWKYEREYRLITSPLFCISETDSTGKVVDFVPIKKEWMTRIYFGVRYPVTERGSFLHLLKEQYPHAESYQAVYHKSDYILDYNRL